LVKITEKPFLGSHESQQELVFFYLAFGDGGSLPFGWCQS